MFDTAMRYVWPGGVDTSGIFAEAQRSRLAAAILTEPARWRPEVTMFTARPRRSQLNARGVVKHRPLRHYDRSSRPRRQDHSRIPAGPPAREVTRLGRRRLQQ